MLFGVGSVKIALLRAQSRGLDRVFWSSSPCKNRARWCSPPCKNPSVFPSVQKSCSSSCFLVWVPWKLLSFVHKVVVWIVFFWSSSSCKNRARWCSPPCKNPSVFPSVQKSCSSSCFLVWVPWKLLSFVHKVVVWILFFWSSSSCKKSCSRSCSLVLPSVQKSCSRSCSLVLPSVQESFGVPLRAKIVLFGVPLRAKIVL